MAGKKFNYNGIASKMDTNTKETIVLDMEPFNGVTIEVRKMIEMDDVLALVRSAANSIMDLETGEYLYEMFEFVTRMYVLNAYAGLPIPDGHLEKAYRVIMCSPLFSIVEKHIDAEQLDQVYVGVSKKVEYYRDCAISIASMKMNELQKVMTDMSQSADELGAQLSPDKMAELMMAINASRQEQEPEKKAVPKTKRVKKLVEAESNIVKLETNKE